jgi:serine/threonine-protein kinase
MSTLASVSPRLDDAGDNPVSSARTISAPPARTISAPPARLSSIPDKPFANTTLSRQQRADREELKGAQLRFRRAFGVGYLMWMSFACIDWLVVRYLGAPSFEHLFWLRVAVSIFALPVLVRAHRQPPPSARLLTLLDLVGYGMPSAALALMCAEFHGLQSQYLPGMCLVLLCRTVTAQDPWRRGLLMSGAPLLAFFGVLFGSALIVPRLGAQFHDPAALTTLGVYASYVLGTYVFLVVGSHVVWTLRRQIFEARNLGRYRLKRRLASGGMGDVWVAYHPGLKRDVAVKILRNDVRMESETAVRRFEREARATAELLHPNTIRVFDYGATDDGLLYYVMELLDGETLAEHVERLGPLPPARAVHIIGQAARALAEAHERGIVHRDVKPENLFLTSLGGEHDFVKVLDFGIAKIADAEGTVTRTGFLLGTPLYMSPEGLAGEPADARSDVYALGAVLYYLLTGKPPFEGDNPSSAILGHLHRTPLSPSIHLRTPLSEELEAIVMKTLRKDPAERYATASEFALALANCSAAGAWTFGDAVEVARHSSRPPRLSDSAEIPEVPE